MMLHKGTKSATLPMTFKVRLHDAIIIYSPLPSANRHPELIRLKAAVLVAFSGYGARVQEVQHRSRS
jgi:hypothetical protein